MGLSHEHIGPKILAKIKIYVLTRAELLFPLCYEIPCRTTLEVSKLIEIFLFYSDSKWNKVQHECIKCLKAIMNNRVGLKDMFEHKEALTLLARSMQPNLGEKSTFNQG
jgi:hypothetical protein